MLASSGREIIPEVAPQRQAESPILNPVPSGLEQNAELFRSVFKGEIVP